MDGWLPQRWVDWLDWVRQAEKLRCVAVILLDLLEVSRRL